MTKEKTKIVILGGGFGGMYTYKSLYKYFSKDKVDITVINKNNYFIFTPLLHEVATGGIEHHQVVESIRQLMYENNDTLHIATVESVDPKKQLVKTNLSEFPYDILVISMGATTNFFATPGAEEHSMVLKDLRDAIVMRNTIIEAFEKASEIKDVEAKRKSLSFAVIGGGPTGVEIVSEISEFINDTLLSYYHTTIKKEDVSLYLINRTAELLGPFPADLRDNALKALTGKGIKVLLNTAVKEVGEDKIVFGDDTTLAAAHTVWAAGVKPNAITSDGSLPLDPGGRIIVNSSLQVVEHQNIFVLGDMASMAGADGKPLPMLAQVATRQGAITGENIWRQINKKTLKQFTFKSQGELASLGRWHAVANIKGVHLSGPLAWFMWRTIYLSKFFSGSKKVRIIVDWTLNIFYPRDITKA